MKKPTLPLLITALALIITATACTLPGVATPEAPRTPLQATVRAAVKATQSAEQSGAPVVSTPGPSATPRPATGAIQGSLSYPASELPPQRVVATNLDTGQAYFVDVAEGDQYTLSDLPVGRYHVLAYIYPDSAGNYAGFAGGYSLAVACGLSHECTDHALLEVEVTGGLTTRGINPGDWYAEKGTFPPMPAIP